MSGSESFHGVLTANRGRAFPAPHRPSGKSLLPSGEGSLETFHHHLRTREDTEGNRERSGGLG